MNFEQVHNYYERLVFEEVARHASQYPHFTDDMLSDAACVALNQLPARYVRHDVDLIFYLGGKDRHNDNLAIAEAVEFAFPFVERRAAAGKI